MFLELTENNINTAVENIEILCARKSSILRNPNEQYSVK
jgi:hypothetical protein